MSADYVSSAMIVPKILSSHSRVRSIIAKAIRSQTSRCLQKEHANRNNATARPKTRRSGPEPLRFLIWSLFSRHVLFNGEGGNRARIHRPMAGRLEIIHEIAGRTAASESGGEVRLDRGYVRSPRLLNIRRACPGTALLSQEVGLPLFDRR
jgi:hypothetical protein